MTITELERFQFRIDWVCVQKSVRTLGMLAFAFALGGWVVSIRDRAADAPYRNRSTKQLEVIHQQVGANPVAAVRCAQHAEVVAKKVAGQAVVSNYNSTVPVPSLSAIPNCPAPPSVRK